MFSKLYIDWFAITYKFKDVFPGFAQYYSLFDKPLFGMSRVILISVKI